MYHKTRETSIAVTIPSTTRPRVNARILNAAGGGKSSFTQEKHERGQSSPDIKFEKAATAPGNVKVKVPAVSPPSTPESTTIHLISGTSLICASGLGTDCIISVTSPTRPPATTIPGTRESVIQSTMLFESTETVVVTVTPASTDYVVLLPISSTLNTASVPASASHSHTGAIVGGVIGGVALLVIIATIVALFMRRRLKIRSDDGGLPRKPQVGSPPTKQVISHPVLVKLYNPDDPSTFPSKLFAFPEANTPSHPGEYAGVPQV